MIHGNQIHRSNIVRAAAGGFTMIELIVTVSIVAILAAVALPSFREMSVRMSVTSTTNDLVGALNLARSEAVKRGYPVNVTANSGSSDWSSGWSVNAVVTPAVPALQTHAAVATSYKVTASIGATGTAQIAFGATGAITGAGINVSYVNVCRPAYAADVSTSRVIEIRPNGSISNHADTTNSLAPGC